MKVCEACTVAKAKQKNVPKESQETAIASKEEWCVFLDISAVKKMKDGPKATKPNWLIVVDQRSTLKFQQITQATAVECGTLPVPHITQRHLAQAHALHQACARAQCHCACTPSTGCACH
jgi:hypothetical protein